MHGRQLGKKNLAHKGDGNEPSKTFSRRMPPTMTSPSRMASTAPVIHSGMPKVDATPLATPAVPSMPWPAGPLLVGLVLAAARAAQRRGAARRHPSACQDRDALQGRGAEPRATVPAPLGSL